MEFGTDKCAMIIMKSRQSKTMEGIQQLNLERVRTLEEKDNYRNLRILEEWTPSNKRRWKKNNKRVPQKS